MGAQTRSLEDAMAATLPLPARLVFVLVFLVFQLYSFSLQVYKVSQEDIPDQIKSLWQRWFLHWFFLGFLKRDRRRPQSHPENALPTPVVSPPAGAPGQPTTDKRGTQQPPPEPLSNGHNKPPEPATENLTTINNENNIDDDDGPSWTSLWVQANTVAIFLIGVALSIPTFNKLQFAQEGLNTQSCTAPIDGDIAGDGVRAALWVQQGILWLSVLTGAFLKPSQPRPTAVKELAAGLVVTHLSLAIAVLVQIGQGMLTPLDAAIVVMILDAQNAALAVSFSSRETLAARWEVVMVSAAQLFGLVVIGVVLARFQEGRFVTPDCACFSFFWWAWQSSCPTSSVLPLAERAVLWTYYAFRWLNSFQNWHFGVRYMWEFNILEQDKGMWDGIPPTSETPGTPGVPPTAGLGFLQNLVFGLVSAVSAELTITGYTSGHEPKPFTVGQITAMVIAVTTTLRATWLFIRRFDLLPMVEEKLWSERAVGTDGVTAGVGDGSVGQQNMAVGQGRESDTDQEKEVRPQGDEVQVADVNRSAGG